MNRSVRLSVLASAILALAGCAAKLQPGAESVKVVASDEAVRGATLVDSYAGKHGAYAGDNVEAEARNFAASRGADMVRIRREGSGVVYYTVEAWRSKPER